VTFLSEAGLNERQALGCHAKPASELRCLDLVQAAGKSRHGMETKW